jgi:hypothetical protein
LALRAIDTGVRVVEVKLYDASGTEPASGYCIRSTHDGTPMTTATPAGTGRASHYFLGGKHPAATPVADLQKLTAGNTCP